MHSKAAGSCEAYQSDEDVYRTQTLSSPVDFLSNAIFYARECYSAKANRFALLH